VPEDRFNVKTTMEEAVRFILTAGALALALTPTACGSASHPGPAPTASAAAVSPTSAAAVSPTSAAAVVSPTSAASVSPTSQASRVSAVESVPSPEPIADWCHGTGYQRWQAVTKDLAALQADSASGAASATKLAVEGRQLASNAAAAASYPPPGVSATAYKKGMEELTVSGRDDERDEGALATTITAEADAYLDNISSYASVKCP
jgi:hypothetical protein